MANHILDRRGFGAQRINQYWLSGAESDKLVKCIEDTMEKVHRLGLNPLKLQVDASEVDENKTIPTPVE